MRYVVIDAKSLDILSEDLDKEERTDWLDDKTIVRGDIHGDEVHLYVRDKTMQDIRDADKREATLDAVMRFARC